MKHTTSLVLFGCALLAAILVLLGDKSLSRLRSLQQSLRDQIEESREVEARVNQLKGQVYRLRHDDRALEKKARNELGLARPNETIFIFEQ